MRGKSILLALSGSRQSRYATEVCWSLAEKLGATITAQHVVDSHSAWEFLGHDKPGFLDSSRYVDVYQGLLNNLFELGESLTNAYAEQAGRLGQEAICVTDEGNPISEICRRAVNHKLVVIGHKPASSKKRAREHFKRLSVAESLAHDCSRPLLIVQDECKEWTSLAIMISLDHINEVFINSCLDMAKALGLNPSLLCLTGGANEEDPEQLVKDFRQANTRLKEYPIAVVHAEKDISVGIEDWYAPENQPYVRENWTNPLIVIPTRMVAGERITVVDSSPSDFVQNMTLPSIMMWPEEFTYSLAADFSEKKEDQQSKPVGLCK